VIGVPLETETLSGLDSLFSMVQMPKGIPVATVSIGRAGAVNAAILAAQILSAKHPELKEKIKRYKKGMAEEVIKRGERLRDVGYKRYQELKKT
jgi:5-(carboxyamino)imidazole ribonucleotide mutase